MLLTITTTHTPATDLGYLLAKNPARAHSFPLNVGQAHVVFPEATDARCTVALLLDIDPVGLVRGRGAAGGLIDQYVNDRPYVASSFLSVAIAEVFGSALNGRSRERPELVQQPIPLEAHIPALPARGGADVVTRLFAPLGYEVAIAEHPLDPLFPAWGQSRVVSLTLRGTVRLSDLLNHLYVLIPVLDAQKHYYFGPDELDKLLRRGAGWLAEHPARELIANRYLRRKRLVREALAQLIPETEPDEEDEEPGASRTDDPVWSPALAAPPDAAMPDLAAANGQSVQSADEPAPRLPPLHTQRLTTTLEQLRASGAHSVLDLGCGEGRLLRLLLAEKQFERIVGMDVAYRALELARDRLRLDRMPPTVAQRLTLIQGSLVYRDARLSGFDAAAVVEVIEHLDLARLAAFERVLFGAARPGTVVLTTPNAEYNVRYGTLNAGTFRHADHRFEWTRAEFAAWCDRVAATHGYTVRCSPVGPEDPELGAPSQLAVFARVA